MCEAVQDRGHTQVFQARKLGIKTCAKLQQGGDFAVGGDLSVRGFDGAVDQL
jgi:hypothetical protein